MVIILLTTNSTEKWHAYSHIVTCIAHGTKHQYSYLIRHVTFKSVAEIKFVEM